jgi:hypothetical protein
VVAAFVHPHNKKGGVGNGRSSPTQQNVILPTIDLYTHRQTLTPTGGKKDDSSCPPVIKVIRSKTHPHPHTHTHPSSLFQTVALLLEAMATPSPTNTHTHTHTEILHTHDKREHLSLLDHASLYGRLEIVRLLCETYEAKIHLGRYLFIDDTHTHTHTHTHIQHGCFPPNPLHLAAFASHKHVCVYLIESVGMNANIYKCHVQVEQADTHTHTQTYTFSGTPLHAAVTGPCKRERERLRCVEYLVGEARVGVDVRNEEGKTALDIGE